MDKRKPSNVPGQYNPARMTAPTDKTERMQVLVEKQQLEGLTDAEK